MGMYVDDNSGVRRYATTLKLNTRRANWQETYEKLDTASVKLRNGQLIDGEYIPSETLTPEEADLLGLHGYRLRSDGRVVRMTDEQVMDWEDGHKWDERFTEFKDEDFE